MLLNVKICPFFKDLEKQEKLRIAHLDLKEHQETIERLMGSVAKRTEEVSDMNMELERANTRLQEKVLTGHLTLHGFTLGM